MEDLPILVGKLTNEVSDLKELVTAQENTLKDLTYQLSKLRKDVHKHFDEDWDNEDECTDDDDEDSSGFVSSSTSNNSKSRGEDDTNINKVDESGDDDGDDDEDSDDDEDDDEDSDEDNDDDDDKVDDGNNCNDSGYFDDNGKIGSSTANKLDVKPNCLFSDTMFSDEENCNDLVPTEDSVIDDIIAQTENIKISTTNNVSEKTTKPSWGSDSEDAIDIGKTDKTDKTNKIATKEEFSKHTDKPTDGKVKKPKRNRKRSGVDCFKSKEHNPEYATLRSELEKEFPYDIAIYRSRQKHNGTIQSKIVEHYYSLPEEERNYFEEIARDFNSTLET